MDEIKVLREGQKGDYFSHRVEAKKLLLDVLAENIKENKYYSIYLLGRWLDKKYDKPQNWISSSILGKMMRELGFKEKRRMGLGIEYLIYVKDVQQLIDDTEATLLANKSDDVQMFGDSTHHT